MPSPAPYWSNTFLAQMAHVGWAGLLVLWVLRWHSGWWAAAVVLGWAVPKEFVFDLLVEKASFWDSLLDFSFYVIGLLAALLACWWFPL